MKPNADILFEVSWEVCNKVGGIYTVIKSKASYISDYYKENYFLVGPYLPHKLMGEFSEQSPPENFKKAFGELQKEGIICHFGKWLIPSLPRAILVDFEGYKHNVNSIKRELWDKFRVDSLRTSYDYDEPVVWAYAVGKLIEKLANREKMVVQVHEWLAGVSLLYLKNRNCNVATVFTTHATILGRSLASSNVDLYCTRDGKFGLEAIDKLKAAYDHCIEAKHLIEHACVLNSDVFTTVSEITAIEASYVHGRKADVLLPNGLDLNKFPTFEEGSISHRRNKEKIHEFLMAYFFPYYSFDVEDCLIFFLAGRYEFHDKGVDIFIDALKRLNEKMKGEKSQKTIIAFIWIPAAIKGIRASVLENKTFFKDIKEKLDESLSGIRENILNTVTSGKKLAPQNIFSEEFLLETRRKISAFQRKGTPPISTHDLVDPNDIIFRYLLQSGLDNAEDDAVKVIFYPIYVSSTDGLLELDYYAAISGCHLGVFPSYYEPWGYTPLEAGALGVSSVTTDLSGFGRYIKGKGESKKYPGIFVLERFSKKDEEIINDLCSFMYDFARFTKQERVQNKIEAKRLASLADWSNFITFYIQAHNMAIGKGH